MIKFTLSFILMLLTLTGFSSDRYPLNNKHQRLEFLQLTQQLRCLVCQNESLEASNAPLANDLKDQVYHMVKYGQSAREIKRYLVDRYGDFILFKPSWRSMTYLLWCLPLLLLLASVIISFIMINRRQSSDQKLTGEQVDKLEEWLR